MQDIYTVNPYAATIPCDAVAAPLAELSSYLRFRVVLSVTWCLMLSAIVAMLQTHQASILTSSAMNLKLTLMSAVALGMLWTGSRGRWRLAMLPVCFGIAILTVRLWLV